MNKKSSLLIIILMAILIFLHIYKNKTNSVDVVNFYGWYGAIPRDVFEDFERETGIKVIVDTFDDNGTAEAKLLAGNSGYDVVVVSLVPYVGRQCLIGVYSALDKRLLPNLKNLGEVITSKFEQNGGDTTYMIPLFWGTTGIVYDEGVLNSVFGGRRDISCDLLFQPKNIAKLKRYGVCFPIEAVDAFMQAGSYLGIHPYESEADMDTCAKTLMDVRRYITKFGASTVIQDILSGDVCAAIGMSDNAFKAIQAANKIEKRVRYVHARVMWIDCFGIPKSAPHRKGAHKLIDYLLRPDISARITNSSGILVNNPRSVGLYKDEIRKDEQICPPSWMVERFTLGHVSRNRRDVAIEKRAERVWTDIKARTSHFATVSQRSTLDVEP